MPVHELDHAVLLTVERSVEALEARFDEHLEDGDQLTNSAVFELRQDSADFREAITALTAEVDRLKLALDKTLEIIKDLLTDGVETA